jgi:predicted RNA-binding protein with EMAP domain
MRYKEKATEKINALGSTLQKLQFQVNRGMTQDEVLETVETLKERLNDLQDLINVEDDEWNQQFRPKH